VSGYHAARVVKRVICPAIGQLAIPNICPDHGKKFFLAKYAPGGVCSNSPADRSIKEILKKLNNDLDPY